jgi:hypothetical protein
MDQFLRFNHLALRIAFFRTEELTPFFSDDRRNVTTNASTITPMA